MRYFCLISHTLIGYCTLVCTYLVSYYNGNMYHMYQHIHKQHIHTHKHTLHLPSKHIIVWSLKGAVLPSSLFTSQRCFYVSGATESSGSISVFFSFFHEKIILHCISPSHRCVWVLRGEFLRHFSCTSISRNAASSKKGESTCFFILFTMFCCHASIGDR